MAETQKLNKPETNKKNRKKNTHTHTHITLLTFYSKQNDK